ncbi:hypothetical protein HBI24_080700 [Parastagonospora nodorum]|nr:hypothetical protein HBH92_233880 [Parastagonospora nodorum]KAH4436553.1 hypothetical protein HBH93_112020 [Parastagonospora nodorum]KAH4438422.1 hypothetical protein HBH91_184240 [Parastagonospora nodorum]KAH4487449.1 hypothetical protein HBH89_199690 [Parastagonospora nodorum]KAH4543145.1 hypothetical protein HBH86_157990 [Parastagonospora nodorum]
MAEQVTKDVVKEAQSVGRPAPIDDTASTTSTPAVNGETPSGPATTASATSKPTPNATDAASASTAPADNVHVSDKPSKAAAATTTEQKPTSAPLHDADRPFLNGDAGDVAIADASGGSDTDISRPGSVDQSKRDASHVRTNSMKKPSTFKSVSVTKNFLKSAVAAPATRPGEKAAPLAPTTTATVPTAKPRLVAKSGAGNAPRTLGKANGASSGPDASKVWNKNQPIPPPPPKQFTDEELKQQYGIHLATRLQADEAGKEAKWADIDDDEDDWAPDTVQWMDGTKSSGAVAENEPPVLEEPSTVAKAPDPVLETLKSVQATTTNITKPSVTGGTKTILKPGAHAQAPQLPTGKSSLVLKGQPEKPTLVTKPSSSEKKSPWATLPPVEKVPPVQINPPVQQPPQRFAQRDSYGYDSMPSHPAKEIAPDDFNRTWRDDRGGRPELFNSQSGRYEPVNDMRRGSVRDPAFRQQPAVLQRPSQDGHAEPSAAFQTSRAGADMPTWGRRRNSSNVSGSNGRRMSFDRRPTDMPNGPMGIERRGSHSMNGVEPMDPASSRKPSIAQAISPNVANAHPASPFGSVASSGVHDVPVHVAAPPVEDPVEVQKRLMTDKIERARLKKQQEREAEEKEEAERKERLAKRLAAMGPPKVKEQSPSPRKENAVPATAQSPPKPPVPAADGEVAQYGMMKVHHAQPVKKASSAEPIKAAASVESVHSPSPVQAHAVNEARPAPQHKQQSAQSFDKFARETENTRQSGEQSKPAISQLEGAVPAGPRSQVAPGWQPTAAAPRPWTSQVWGPPQAKDRALGNGTFGSSYDRAQSRGSPQQPPAQSQSTPTASVNLNIAPTLPHSQPPSTMPTAQPMRHQAGSLSAQPAGSARPGPIAPPAVKPGWGNFAAHIAQDDKNLATKARQDNERLTGARPELRETYKDQRGQSQAALHETAAPNKSTPNAGVKMDEAVKSIHEGQLPQQPLGQAPLQATGPRASRFFPRSTETSQPTMMSSSKADSPPPPPETESHPAFTGSAGQPLVRLPKPSPVVRLPPAAVGGGAQSEAPVTMPPRGNPGLGARPLAMNPEWQARFNKLLEKPGTSPAQAAHAATQRSAAAVVSASISKTGSLPVAASSKAALDVRGNAGLATVSLPNASTRRSLASDRGSDVITRKGTEVLFEDREFGSLPTVKLSKVSHLAANEPVVQPPNDDSVLIRFKKIENPFTQRRLETFDLERAAQKVDVVIRISTMRQGIVKAMPRARRGPKTSIQYNKPKRNSNVPNGSPSSNPKDRSRKPSQQSQNDRPSSSARPSTTNAWTNNNRSTPGSTPATTWARRAAAPVH